MLKIKFLLVIFFLCTISIFSQESLNDYKYVIVPNQYNFQKSEDSFKVNSLTKFLFNKVGFTAILNNENFPDDLARNRCLALTVKLNKGKSLLITKMNIDLVNCNNVVVFSTKEASTKEKDYKKAYHEVIRKTFEGIKAENYKYAPKEEIVESLKIYDFPLKEIIVKEKIILKEESKIVIPTIKETSDLLYAQPIQNGFQLVDNTPKRVYVIQYTSVKDIYILKDKNGILYKKGNNWIAEYYEGDKLIKNKLNIKF